MNNALFLNVSELSFFCFGVYFYCCLFLFYFLFWCLIAFFNNKNHSFFGLRYVPSVIKAKRNAVGLFHCSLAEDGTMFVRTFIFLYLTPSSAARF